MSQQSKFKIIGLGELLWDMLPDGKKLGGAPANFAYHSNALGNEGFIVSAIGKDNLGAEILNVLQSNGLNSSYIEEKEKFPTGTVEIELDEEGKPQYNIIENVKPF